MRRSLLLLAGCLAVFVMARVAYMTFFAHIVPVGYADEPQPLWAVEAAFVLQAIENVSVAAAALVLAVIAGNWLWPTLRARKTGG